MNTEWESRVKRFWESVDPSAPEAALREMHALMQQYPSEPAAIYEWASAHDYVGLEAEAIPLYESALAAGLSGDRRPQAIIQLASSLRNVGRAEDAVRLLREDGKEDRPIVDKTVGDSAQAFLALALHSSGRKDDALRVALLALANTLPMYRGAISRYAEELIEE